MSDRDEAATPDGVLRAEVITSLNFLHQDMKAARADREKQSDKISALEREVVSRLSAIEARLDGMRDLPSIAHANEREVALTRGVDEERRWEKSKDQKDRSFWLSILSAVIAGIALVVSMRNGGGTP